MKNPILVGERIYLRHITPDDFERSMDWLNDQDITRYMQKAYPQTIESMTAYYRAMQKPNLYLAICLKTDKHIGNITLRDNSADKYYSEISIMIGDKEYIGFNYGTDAIKLLTDYCFRKRNIHKLVAGTASCNYACIKSFQKAGYFVEWMEQDAVFADGEYRNIVRLSRFKKGET